MLAGKADAKVGRKPAPATTTAPHTKNPKRVAAGKQNRMKRKGLTPEGRERLRQAALENQPWLRATGPRTAEGKARSAENSRVRQLGPRSIRQVRRELGELRDIGR